MPLPVENLTKDSSEKQIQDAISETIRYLIKNEGKTQKEAAGQAYGMARERTGKSLDRGR